MTSQHLKAYRFLQGSVNRTPRPEDSPQRRCLLDEVIRSLKSGKEATVYPVRFGAHTRRAKVYRDMSSWTCAATEPSDRLHIVEEHLL